MGEVEDDSVSESQIPTQKKKSLLFSMIMLIIGLFSPVLISVFNYNSSSPDVNIQGMFWMYRLTSSQYIAAGFSITIDPNSWIVMFPFLLLRIAPVSQIYRYYNGKTTRIRVFIASIIGDGLFLFSSILIWFVSLGQHGAGIHIPLPFQIIFSFFVLLIFRGPKPPVTWESKQSTKSWWAKEPDSQQEKVADDELW